MNNEYAGGGVVFHTRILAVIREVSECICNFNRSEHDVLSDVIAIIEARLGIYATRIILAGQDGKDLIAACCSDLSDSLSTTKSKPKGPGRGISRQVRDSGEPAVIRNFTADSVSSCCRKTVHDNSSPDCITTLICVPIIYNAQSIGTLSSMIDDHGDSDFSIEVNGLSIIAGLIANVVSSKRELMMKQELLQNENEHLRSLLNLPGGKVSVIGDSPAMQAVLNRARQVAEFNTTVLLQGDSGTGKELIADVIHFQSQRADKPIVKLNCSAINSSLFESELFGHVRGAFTGAENDHPGYIAQAQGGTLFFDEVADFSPEIQVKLLRFLQERNYQPVGSSKTVSADVRIILASRKNVADLVNRGTFREDLWFRINGFIIDIPSLSQRPEDIIPLANFYLRKYAVVSNKDISGISQPALDIMIRYNWPGNIRELQNWIEYAILTCTGNCLEICDLPVSANMLQQKKHDSRPATLQDRLSLIEHEIVLSALQAHDNHIESAAKELGITPRMLNYKIKNWKLDIKRPPRKRQ